MNDRTNNNLNFLLYPGNTGIFVVKQEKSSATERMTLFNYCVCGCEWSAERERVRKY